jgi:hypothetical protein
LTDAIFVDTTIQVDRIIQEFNPDKKAAIEALLGKYDLKAACTFSMVEFKRVVLQNLSLCLRYLNEEGSYLRALNRATSLGPRRARRISTLISILTWVGMKVDDVQAMSDGGTADELLTLQSISFIRINILFLWKRFEKSVDTLLDKTKCSRAKEVPKKDEKGNVLVPIRESLCGNEECSNVNFFRNQLPMIRKTCARIDELEKEGKATQELKEARNELKRAMTDQIRLYNYKNCLKVGDVWLHLECLASGIKEFGTTNYKESAHLCPVMGLNMRNPY